MESNRSPPAHQNLSYLSNDGRLFIALENYLSIVLRYFNSYFKKGVIYEKPKN